MDNKIRLNKFISDSGYCSRREADTYIEQGRVTVNRKDCTEKGAMVLPTDRVEVDGELIKVMSTRIYIALNKPSGITCTTDREDKTNIVDFVGHKERIFPIGRLDKLSQGLIFMTNDGDIVNKILRAGNAHEKEYIVTVDKPITEDFLKKMSSGVRIEMGVRTLPCKVTREAENRFRIILKQGLNRQIRRMCDTLHYDVKKLQRVRIMNITLSGIPEGEWRYFTQNEIDEINSTIDNSVGTEEASKVSSKSTLNDKPKESGRRGEDRKGYARKSDDRKSPSRKDDDRKSPSRKGDDRKDSSRKDDDRKSPSRKGDVTKSGKSNRSYSKSASVNGKSGAAARNSGTESHKPSNVSRHSTTKDGSKSNTPPRNSGSSGISGSGKSGLGGSTKSSTGNRGKSSTKKGPVSGSGNQKGGSSYSQYRKSGRGKNSGK